MLFDLRVVLAACLATLFFLAVGLGLLTGLRSPFKASAGYAHGPLIAGPGLPQERYWPVPDESKPEVTGSVAEPVAPEPPAQTVPEPAKAAPAASPSITTLIEEDKASREKAAKAAKPTKATSAAKKKAAVKKKKPHRAARKPPPASSPFSLFTNKNTTTQ